MNIPWARNYFDTNEIVFVSGRKAIQNYFSEFYLILVRERNRNVTSDKLNYQKVRRKKLNDLFIVTTERELLFQLQHFHLKSLSYSLEFILSIIWEFSMKTKKIINMLAKYLFFISISNNIICFQIHCLVIFNQQNMSTLQSIS